VHVPVLNANVMVQESPAPPRPSETVTEPLGLPVNCGFTVAVAVVLCPNAIVLTESAIVVVVLAWFTVKETVLLVVPAPLSVAVMAPVVFVLRPRLVPITFTEIVHELLAATLPADRLIEPEPAVAVVAPPHVLTRLFGLATPRPAGKASVKATPLRPIVFGLLIVKLKLVLPLKGIEDAPNVLVIVGGLATVKLAEAVLPVPPLLEVTVPVVLFFTPEVVPVTFTVSVHETLIATEPPLRLTLPPPAVAVAVPPQVSFSAFGVATTSPLGNVSETATPLSATVFAVGLVIVIVKLVVPFTAIVETPNALAIVGGVTTDSTCVAEAVPAEPVSVGPPALVSL